LGSPHTTHARDSRVDRYYDPSTDQFLSVDPDLAETGQPYAFTGDDPLNATDPLGLKCKKGHSCPVARRAPSVSSTLTKSRVVIPDFLGMKITVTGSAQVTSGGDPARNVGITSDGELDATVGSTTFEFSPNHPITEVMTSHGLSVSSDGDVSYTSTTHRTEDGNTVVASVTATLSPAPNPDGSGTALNENDAAAGAGVFGVLGVIGKIGKAVYDFCTSDQPEVCTP
jgi:hypothetical protein